MSSAEVKRVRDGIQRDDPPPPESVTGRPKRIRDSIRREDPDDEPVRSERPRGPESRAGQRMSWAQRRPRGPIANAAIGHP